jgi:hypothetical protein
VDQRHLTCLIEFTEHFGRFVNAGHFFEEAAMGYAPFLPTGRESYGLAVTEEPIHDHEAENLLRQSPYSILRNVCCEKQDGRLVLRGRVPCYYLKQIAQTTIVGAAGQGEIVNEIEVTSRYSRW